MSAGEMLGLVLSEAVDLSVAVGTGALAVATLVLACSTRKMVREAKEQASATRDLARAADEQLEQLRRQADATERAVAHEDRRARAEGLPSLRVLRGTGDEAVAGESPEGWWSVTIRNRGSAAADIREAKLGLPGAPIALTPEPSDVPPETNCALSFEIGDYRGSLDEAIRRSKDLELTLRYETPGGEIRHWQTVLRPKSGGERWLVVRREGDKPHGAYASW